MKPQMMSGPAQPPGADPDTQAFETMVAGIREHMFGAAEKGIAEQLGAAQDLPKEIGALTTALVYEASQQAGEAGVVLDIDIVMGVATEIIDDLLDIAIALGVLPEATDEIREACLMAALEVYSTMAETSPEEQAMAQEQLAMMRDDGTLEEGVNQVAKRGEELGVDPFAEGQQSPAQQAPPPGAGRPQLMG